jgi:hypothetical protein
MLPHISRRSKEMPPCHHKSESKMRIHFMKSNTQGCRDVFYPWITHEVEYKPFFNMESHSIA